jgi:hypothetical protein
MVDSIQALDEARLNALSQMHDQVEEEDKEDVVMEDAYSEPKDYWFTSSMIDAFLETPESQKEDSLY